MSKARKLTLSAMFAALVFVATFIVHIPLPANGYAHLGDALVILSGWILGPLYGAAAAGVGSAISDLCAGYPLYIGATFVIKSLTALLAGATAHLIKKKTADRVLSAVLSAWAVPAGYFVFEYFALGYAAAIADIAGNIVQAAVGSVCAVLLSAALDKTPLKIRK